LKLSGGDYRWLRSTGKKGHVTRDNNNNNNNIIIIIIIIIHKNYVLTLQKYYNTLR
jgi:hypothetical protein